MFEFLIWATGAVVAVAVFEAYRRTRDALHPLMFLGPMVAYVYCLSPAMLYYRDQFAPLFRLESSLEYVQTINLLGIILFCVGCLWPSARRGAAPPGTPGPSLPEEEGMRLRHLSYFFGCLGLLAYVWSLVLQGGFVESYSRPKGGGAAPSGYLGEAPMLAIPAIIFYMISLQKRKPNVRDIAFILLFAAPHLIQGLLGARRGPIFLILVVLFWGWYLASARRPSLRAFTLTMTVMAAMVFLVWSHRKQIYIGSEFSLDPSSVVARVAPEEAETGDLYLVGAGQILNSRYHDRHFWGKRYAVVLLVRPIPRQLWPTKYEDSGMPQFAAGDPNDFDKARWKRSVGWYPDKGSAPGFIADLYLEFGHWGLLGCLAVGFAFSRLWQRSVSRGGVWIALYVIASAVSIYLPTQSLSAWLYRFLFMAAPTILVWKLFVHERLPGPLAVPAGNSSPPIPIEQEPKP